MRFGSEPSDILVPVKRTMAGNKFTFDVTSSEDYYKDLHEKYQKLSNRINNLVDNATVCGHPFIKYVFQTVENPEVDELKRLGNALNLIADLYPVLQALSEQIHFIEFGRKNPDVAELVFGDMPSAVESLLNKINDI